MEFSWRKSVVILIFILLMSVTAVQAHRMVIEEHTSGQIKVGFEDGTRAQNVEVLLFDEEEEKITEGETDENGIFQYDSDIDPEKIVAEDHMGHRAVWEQGDQKESFIENIPVFLRAILGTVVILAVGGVVSFKMKA